MLILARCLPMDRLTTLQAGGGGCESLKTFGKLQIDEKALAEMRGPFFVLILRTWRADYRNSFVRIFIGLSDFRLRVLFSKLFLVVFLIGREVWINEFKRRSVMNLLSNMSLRAVMIVLGALLLTAAVACNSDDPEPTQVASDANAVMADDDAMMDDEMMADEMMADEMMADEMMADDDAMMDDEMMADDDAMMDDEMMAVDEAMMDDEMMADDDAMMEHSPTKFSVVIENVGGIFDFTSSGVGADAPAGPGDSFSFEFDAAPGSSLSFATMFVPSNDYFFSPSENGIELYDSSGSPVSADVTDQIMLWDAGTEENQEPGTGSEQPLMNGGNANDTPDSNSNVRLAADTFSNLPAVSDVVRVTVRHLDGTTFRAIIENVSTEGTLVHSSGGSSAVPLTPPFWVVHTAAAPLFTNGQSDRGDGLELLAETGSPAALAAAIGARTGLTSPIAPGAFAVHNVDSVLFGSGVAVLENGLESLAEDGSPAALGSALESVHGVSASGVFTNPVGSDSAAPAFPGDSYSFEIEAVAGDRLSLASMLVQSNDLFYAPSGTGIELFDESGSPISGDVTSQFLLWDAGTEVNQIPGVGADQAPRQSGPNTGESEMGVVMQVDDGNMYPDVDLIIRVTITPMG